MKYINFKTVSIAIILLAALSIFSQYADYNRTMEIIEEHDCVPTNHATQEFDGNRISTTKVFYQCSDHGRWLESNDLWQK